MVQHFYTASSFITPFADDNLTPSTRLYDCLCSMRSIAIRTETLDPKHRYANNLVTSYSVAIVSHSEDLNLSPSVVVL